MIRLLQFAEEDERDVIEFFCGVGFRNGEGTHTEWHDIDFRNKEITIYSKAERFDWNVKDSEKRTVEISDRLVERLKARHKRHPGDGLVFPNSSGNPDKHLLRIVKRVALRARLNCGHCMGMNNTDPKVATEDISDMLCDACLARLEQWLSGETSSHEFLEAVLILSDEPSLERFFCRRCTGKLYGFHAPLLSPATPKHASEWAGRR